MAFDIGGVIAIIVFYLAILAVGLWAARKSGTGTAGPDSEDVMLAGRSIGLIVGIFTMTATWVGGGYINGTSEVVFVSGIVWCQAPFGYCLSLILGGLFFANRMRTEGYVTMLDPFQRKYGMRMGGLLFIPALLGEVFWSAAILSALGATLAVLLSLNRIFSIVISATIAVFYTLFGGLYSVAYTDVIQLLCIFIGLWVCIPFALYNEHVSSIFETREAWIGTVATVDYGIWLDCGCMLMLGGIPWQVYFQRVLSSKNGYRAQVLSYVAAVGCLIMAVPSVIIGAIAKSTDWPSVATFARNTTSDDNALVLPLVLQHLTPVFVSYLGLGAISAAVMSSADSSILGASSMFARNIYKLIIHQKASESTIIWVMRGSILVIGLLATVTAITVKSVYGLWFLCSDLVYVILFPQLICVIYVADSNSYGALSGYVVGLVLRLLAGEPLLNIPPTLLFYGWREADETLGEVFPVQRFPFRTTAMIVTLTLIISVSKLTKWAFESGALGAELDLLKAVVNRPDEEERRRERAELHALEEVKPIIKPAEIRGSIRGIARRRSSVYRAAVALGMSFDEEESAEMPTRVTDTIGNSSRHNLIGAAAASIDPDDDAVVRVCDTVAPPSYQAVMRETEKRAGEFDYSPTA